MRLIFLLFSLSVFILEAQQTQKISWNNADRIRSDASISPDEQMLIGNVELLHDATIMTCDSAVLNQKENMFKAFHRVRINQGDSIRVYGDTLIYYGNRKLADLRGHVRFVHSDFQLYTEKLQLDRRTHKAYYPEYGTIIDSVNRLTSERGEYYIEEKKFEFLTDVRIVNQEYTTLSSHLLYYPQSKTSYFYGPSSMTGKDYYLYSERGIHNSNTKLSNLTENALLRSQSQIITSDSIYHNGNLGYATATGRVQLRDTVEHLLINCGYAESYEFQDSSILLLQPVITYIDISEKKDSLHIHADTVILKKDILKNKILLAYPQVKFYKSDLQGRCDSLYSNETEGLLKLVTEPIVWSGLNQITGDSIYLTRNKLSKEMDSLFVIENAFIVSQEDSTGYNYNQIKGKIIRGKFIENDLRRLHVLHHAQTIYFSENSRGERIGINKAESESIRIELREKNIERILFISQPEATLYPESELPNEARRLKGLIWHEDKRIQRKEDIFKKN